MSKTKLPAEEHFRQLSRRGLVAFAARCVQRLQTLPPYEKSRHDLEHTVHTLWQYPRDLSEEPDAQRHRAEIEIQRDQLDLDLVLKACQVALDALSESGEDVLRSARDLAVATREAARLVGHDIARLIQKDVRALYALSPGPFPEGGDPFEELDVEVLSPLWPDRQ